MTSDLPSGVQRASRLFARSVKDCAARRRMWNNFLLSNKLPKNHLLAPMRPTCSKSFGVRSVGVPHAHFLQCSMHEHQAALLTNRRGTKTNIPLRNPGGSNRIILPLHRDTHRHCSRPRPLCLSLWLTSTRDRSIALRRRPCLQDSWNAPSLLCMSEPTGVPQRCNIRTVYDRMVPFTDHAAEVARLQEHREARQS